MLPVLLTKLKIKSVTVINAINESSKEALGESGPELNTYKSSDIFI